jgi:hypothetical protein
MLYVEAPISFNRRGFELSRYRGEIMGHPLDAIISHSRRGQPLPVRVGFPHAGGSWNPSPAGPWYPQICQRNAYSSRCR